MPMVGSPGLSPGRRTSKRIHSRAGGPIQVETIDLIRTGSARITILRTKGRGRVISWTAQCLPRHSAQMVSEAIQKHRKELLNVALG